MKGSRVEAVMSIPIRRTLSPNELNPVNIRPEQSQRPWPKLRGRFFFRRVKKTTKKLPFVIRGMRPYIYPPISR